MNPDSSVVGWAFWLAVALIGATWELLQQPGTLFGLAMLALLVFVCR